ncbi:hypothetical protein [Caulobacter soli]|uniref:hypothetical protein n=1 Tax=Caulobacter soli TaxID=2708539 RepID=UPI0013ECC92B|nr:hypothetical protein [Caulobacter soli]
MTRLLAQARLLAQDWHVAPVNAAMISAVLDFADIHRDLGGGRTLMRLSPERVLRADIILLLGRDAERAADIGLVWNDREDQIVRIIDDAALRASRQEAWEEAFDLFDADDRDQAPQRLCA